MYKRYSDYNAPNFDTVAVQRLASFHLRHKRSIQKIALSGHHGGAPIFATLAFPGNARPLSKQFSPHSEVHQTLYSHQVLNGFNHQVWTWVLDL